VGTKSQAKGRRAEIELASLLRQHGYDVRPGSPLNYGKEPDIMGLSMIHCEVKRCEQLRLSEWMVQAERDAQRFQDGLPAVFFRRSREPWAVVMRLKDWIKLYGSAAEAKSQALGNLSYTQALRLLAIPDEEERERFAAENADKHEKG